MRMNAKTEVSGSVIIYSLCFIFLCSSTAIKVLAQISDNVWSQRKPTAFHNDATSQTQLVKNEIVKNESGIGSISRSCSLSLDGNVTMNCSHRNLASVPENIQENVNELILSYNRIQTLPAGVFAKCRSLQTLDLSYNNLSHLGAGAFDGLHELRILRVKGNPLKLSNTTFTDDVFEPLHSLVSLNLKSNWSLDDAENQYPDVALGKLSSLKTLLISGLSNRTFGKGVGNMTSLWTLDLSWTPSFKSISNETFESFRGVHLKHLFLDHCNLSFIHKETFVHLPNIDTIDYSYNKHLEFRGVGISFYGLQNSTIRKIVMQRVHVKTFLTVVRKADMKYLKNTNLEELHIDNNTIGQLEEGVLLMLPLSMKVLHASWNNIHSYTRQMARLLRFQNGIEIDGSYQMVDLPGANGERDVSHPLEGSHEGLSETSKQVPGSGMKDSHAVRKYMESRLPSNLWMVNFSNNYKVRYTIPHLVFKNSNVSHLNFARNLLDKWIGPLKGVGNLRHLDLTGNNCYTVSETFFAYATNLETLLIGENRIGKDFSDNTFYNLTKLRRLDMNDNQLETVGPNLFSRLTSLTYLNLSQNYISEWRANISGLVKLVDLDLSYNKQRALPLSLCKNLDNIQQFSPLQVDIQGNQLQCIYDTEYFIQWLTKTKVHIRNLNSTLCTLANGTVLSLKGGTSILNHLQRHCRFYTVLIGGLCACLSLFIIMVLVGIVRRHRWKLRYLFYMATNWRKRTGYQRLDTVEENPFCYDAFVSYEDSDRTFIREQVISRLEREAGLKLCIDKRDFLPGLYVTDNILHAIQNSRKTVVFVSRKFLKSKWCVYELNMARMEGIHTGRDVLVIVLTEKIPTSQLSAEVVDVIHNQTYMEMTNNRYGEEIFWERLVSANKTD